MKRGVFIIGQQPPLKQIEKEIRSLVYLLNQAPYIQTHASCSGHPNMQKREWKDGWITIKPVGNPEKLWDFSESLLARLDKRSRRASSGNLNSFQWCWDLVRHVHEILGQEEEFQPQEDGRRQFLAHGRFVLRPVVKNAPVERTREEHLKIWKLIELTARELIHGEMYSERGTDRCKL